MSFSNEVNAELGLVFFVAKGYMKTKELVDLEKASFKDPARRPNMKIITDVRLANLDVDLDSLKALIARNRELNQSGWELEKTAFITNNHLLISLANSYELMSGDLPLQLKVCKTLEDAITWLELDADKERVQAAHQRLLAELA